MVKNCLICGKEFEARSYTKYCSAECAAEAKRRGARQYYKDRYIRKERDKYIKICIYCGEEFESGSSTGKVCHKPECRRLYRLWCNRRVKAIAKEPIAKEQKNSMGVKEIVIKATALGLSYGEYVARYVND